MPACDGDQFNYTSWQIGQNSHRIFALTLVPVGVDRCRWETAIVQEVIKQIDLCLGVAEDDGPGWLHLEQEIEDGFSLLVLIDPHDVLANVLVGLASAPDADLYIVLGHVLTGESASFLLECGGKHHVDVVRVFVCV